MARESKDGLELQEAESALRDHRGGEFDTNKNMVSNLLAKMPDSIRDVFTQSRSQDGGVMINNPEVFKWLNGMAREINPAASVVPNAVNAMETMTQELNALKDRMGEDGWHSDKAANDRYMVLTDAINKMNQR